MMNRFRISVLLASALVVVTGACASGGSGKASAPTIDTANAAVLTTATVAKPAAAEKITHVFVINLENENYATSWGAKSKAKYLNATLRPKGALLTQYFGIGHVSLDNYIAQISGQAPNHDTNTDCITYNDFVSTGPGAYGQELGTGCVFPSTVQTIGDQLQAAATHVEGLPGGHRQLGDVAEDVPAPGDRNVRLVDRPDQDRHVRDAARPVGVLPRHHRLARVQHARWSGSTCFPPTSPPRRRRRTSRTSRRTCATTATTPRARTVDRAGSCRPTRS